MYNLPLLNLSWSFFYCEKYKEYNNVVKVTKESLPPTYRKQVVKDYVCIEVVCHRQSWEGNWLI